MPAIQTYEARAIRQGYTVHRDQHAGLVLEPVQTNFQGVTEILLACSCSGAGQHRLWVPAHSAVHAERAL